VFNRRTLFVVGAGATAEAGMPVGTSLASTIGKKMDIRFDMGTEHVGTGDLELFSHMRNTFRAEANEYQRAGWLIRDGITLSQSIDDFLDLHRNNERVNLYGKAAIVKAVLEAERASKLYFGGTSGIEKFPSDNIADTWFVKFMRMLGRGIPKENVRQIFDYVSFIVFNYDRCVEHFLLHSLQKLYGISEQEASAILDDVQIVHPYGLIGDLERSTFRGGIPFGGGDRLTANYVALSDEIKTYTERVASADLLLSIEAEMQKAKCVVFLGFAYHSQNMRLLKPSTAIPNKRIFGTAYGMSAADTEVVSHQIADFFSPTMTTKTRSTTITLENNLTCAGLFDSYSKSLTGGD
jgi:hypothetical protein